MAGKHVSLSVHLVWSTAGRYPWIEPGWNARLYAYAGGILRAKRAVLLGAGGMPDHAHFCVSLPSTLSLAELVGAVKANSSRWVKESISGMSKFAWQEGYGAFGVGHSDLDEGLAYIRNQPEHHRGRTFQDEYLDFLRQHQVPYDERYLWG